MGNLHCSITLCSVDIYVTLVELGQSDCRAMNIIIVIIIIKRIRPLVPFYVDLEPGHNNTEIYDTSTSQITTTSIEETLLNQSGPVVTINITIISFTILLHTTCLA